MVKFLLSLQADVVNMDFQRARSLHDFYSAKYCAIFDDINVDRATSLTITFGSGFEINKLLLIGGYKIFAVELHSF